jgi:molybdopterin-guanine dinucleotide biosynthesis protein A
LIDADVFQTLWDTRTKEADAVIPVAYNRNQGTSALYHKRILPQLESTFQYADHSLYSLTEKLNSIKVEFEDDKRFWNMNTKKDFVEISNFIANKV